MVGWITIAKNEVRKYTSKYRKNRTRFWIIIASIVVIICIIIPIITHAIADPLIKQALADFGLPISVPLDPRVVELIIPYILPIFQISMLMMFFMFILYPVGQALQELNIGHLELVLSAPIRAKDVLLGEYMGQVPIVAIGVAILSSIFISLISLLIQVTIIVVIIFTLVILTTYLTATWIGTILAAWLSMKFGFSEKGKDKAKSFAMVFSIMLLVPQIVLQIIPAHFPELLTDPIFRAIFQFVPTSWIADTIFILFLSSASITFVGAFPIFNSVTIPLFLTTFFGLTFYLGYVRLDKIYNFESEAQSTTMTIVKENAFYRFTKNHLGRFFTVQLKDFFRRRENLTRLIYAVAVAVMTPLIMSFSMKDAPANIIGLGFWILITGIMYSIMLGSMLGSTIMLRSKDMVWIYKKSPKGSKTLAYSFFWAIAFISMILSIPLTIINTFLIGLDIVEWVVLFLFTNIFAIGTLLMSIGIQALNPTYKEKSGKMTVNVLLTIGILVVLMFLGFIFAQMAWNIRLAYDTGFYFVPLIVFLLGLPIYFVGVRHLDNLE
ncbi:MAG: hypothetical protein EAX96_04640 [Candidatus Lokiarchaeota archaeon]|nr:hypothetical protein [Candidatus Lokiarchaeota archaeon]